MRHRRGADHEGREGRRRWLAGVAALAALSMASAASAQVTPPADAARPAYRQQRSDEDWSVLRDPSRRSDWWDPVKYIPLRSDPEWYLTLGGEFRPFYEFYDHYNWGAGPEDDTGFFLERVMVHADVHMGHRSRVFVELKRGVEAGRAGGPRLPDEDRLDVNQAFLDVGIGTSQRSAVTLRLGRQEVDYGDGSLVSYREGPNVRRGYDGAKVIVRLPAWQVETFLFRPVDTAPGAFDDGWDDTRGFWGVYASAREPLLGVLGRPEVYYLGLRRDGARYDQGVARETRHTVGVRTKAHAGPLEYWFEGTIQFGAFGAGAIRAWKHVQVYGYAFDHARLRPRLGLNVAVSSGDRDPDDADLQIFHPLFPRGLYYGYIDGTGSLNAVVVHPSATLAVSRTVSLRNELFLFWRQRTTDGIYSQPGFLLRTGRQSDARFVGALFQTELTWRLDPHATATFQAGRYRVGPYLRETPPARDMTYLSAKVSYKF